MSEAHKSKLKNALLVQLGLSECICLISFKIPIMFLMESHCCKDFHGLLEGPLMKYVNSSLLAMGQLKTEQSYLMEATWFLPQRAVNISKVKEVKEG